MQRILTILTLLLPLLTVSKTVLVDTSDNSRGEDASVVVMQMREAEEPPTPPERPCADGWTKVGTSCYYLVSQFMSTWSSAKSFCHGAMRARLAVFEDASEMEAVGTAFYGSGMWVGGVKDGSGAWMWEKCGSDGGGGCQHAPLTVGLWERDVESKDAGDVCAYFNASHNELYGYPAGTAGYALCEYEL